MTMRNICMSLPAPTGIWFGVAIVLTHFSAAAASASPAGEACRKEICSTAVTSCMHTDQTLNPFARTEAEKQSYCATFFNGCMTRNISADVPWYSPETLTRFLKCPP